MKEKLWTIFFAVLLAVVGYIMVSTAATRTELDHQALYMRHLERAVKP